MKKTFLICILAIVVLKVQAQLKGTHLLGDMGLKSGSQAPPSVSILVPVYFYNTSSLRDDNGDKRNANPDLNMFITGAGVSWVSNLKILGGNYGASVLLPFAQNRIQANAIESKSSLAFTDTYVQPLQLGWTSKMADFVASYSLYIPTGKFSQGASDNSGLGLWANEFAGGTTLYFDKEKKGHFSTLVSYGINSKKKDTDIEPGDILSIEGGLGRTFYGMKAGSPMPVSIFNAGLTYYMQFKATEDKIPLGSSGSQLYLGNKDHLYALGAEGNVYILKQSLLFGARWLAEIGAKNRFQGQTFFLTAAYVINTGKGEKNN